MTRIYGLFDPRDGQLRYVGKTRLTLKRRLSYHLTPHDLRSNTWKNNWLRQLLSLGLKPQIDLFEEVPDECSALFEKWHVSHWKSVGAILTNSTEGGEGRKPGVGKRWSSEFRAKMSSIRRDLSQETRRRMSEAAKGNRSHLGCVVGEEGRQRMRDARNRYVQKNPLTEYDLLELARKRGDRRVVDQEGNVFENAAHAARSCGAFYANVWNVLNGRKKSVKGKVFRYLTQET